MWNRRWQGLGVGLIALVSWGQAPKGPTPPQPVQAAVIEEQDAHRTREELNRLMERYPPTVKGVFALDPSLLSNAAYLAPYPALTAFLATHPDVARNPSFYFYVANDRRFAGERPLGATEVWRDALRDLSVFAGFGMAIGLLTWLIRTLIDYRRWSRLSKVQSDVHTKILDRFSANEDLLAYMQSPSGSKFLQSAPIALDAGVRGMGAPLGRILWSVQTGIVLGAGGGGLWIVSGRVNDDASQPLFGLGILAMALGAGFVVSAIISFMISHRLGLIDTKPASPPEPPSSYSPGSDLPDPRN